LKLGQYELGPNDTPENGIYCGDARELAKAIPDESVDLTLTSPPYDNLRTYGKSFSADTFDWHPIIAELYRVTKLGGVVVWVVADGTIKGSETGTSFRQALWAMECGFNLHDTMIYQTDRQPQNGPRYEPKFEYMFVLSRERPTTWNPIMASSKYAGSKCSPKEYNSDGSKKAWWGNGIVKPLKVKGNVWSIPSGKNKSTTDTVAHPAIFPEALAHDHIISWSNPGDTVLDPMGGSGTTCKIAKQTGRHWLAFDISASYCAEARERVRNTQPPLFVPEPEQQLQMAIRSQT